MAYTIKYELQKLRFVVRDDCAQEAFEKYKPQSVGSPIPGVRAVFFEHGDIWEEASAYLAERAFTKSAMGEPLDAIEGDAGSLRAYAEFLESNEGLEWWKFPEERFNRPTYLFRGYLVRKRNDRQIAPSTATRHISSIKRFYEWVLVKRLLDPAAEPYREKRVGVSYTDSIGLEHSISARSSDLAIPYRSAASTGVDGGLRPITIADRDALLSLVEGEFPKEFILHLKLGFFTGMRIGTIVTLTESALRASYPSHEITGWRSITIGPGTLIKTKGNVRYNPSIPPRLLSELLEYCVSSRRRVRGKKAAPELQDLVFITDQGRQYTTRSNSQNMTKLRLLAKTAGMSLAQFNFHDTRATFGTALVLKMLKARKSPQAIMPVLMAAMGHKSASSSLGYIKFIEEDSADTEANAQYAKALLEPQS